MNEHEANNIPKNDTLLASGSLPHSRRHQWLIDDTTNDFLKCLGEVPNEKWTASLVPVPFGRPGGKKLAPKLLVELGGVTNPTKIMLANKALIDWLGVMKKKSKNPGKCPWYQPSTQNQRLRTLVGHLSKQYDWRMDISNFSFPGGLKGFLDKLYAKRLSEFGKVS